MVGLIRSSKIYEIQYISDKGPISLDNFNLCLQHWRSRMEYRCDKGIFVRKPQGFQDPKTSYQTVDQLPNVDRVLLGNGTRVTGIFASALVDQNPKQ